MTRSLNSPSLDRPGGRDDGAAEAVAGARLVDRRVAVDEFHVEAERLKLAHEHVERLGDARVEVGLALDDGLVNLRPARHVVRLRGEQLLKDVRRAVSFERPDLHLAETLAAELRLAAEGLLRDERVGP